MGNNEQGQCGVARTIPKLTQPTLLEKLKGFQLHQVMSGGNHFYVVASERSVVHRLLLDTQLRKWMTDVSFVFCQ